MITLLSVDPAEYDEIAGRLLSRFSTTYRLVFVLGSDEFGPFLARGLPIEHLTPLDVQAQFSDLLDWPGYLTEKWALLLLKWRPEQVVAYGLPVDRFLNLSRQQANAV